MQSFATKEARFKEAVNLLNVSRVMGCFFPISSNPPAVGASTPKSQKSSPHCVKDFADDLTIISQYEYDHASVLRTFSKNCSVIDLEIRPDKFVSVVYNGSKGKKTCSFPIEEGHTRKLSSDAVCFLALMLVHSL